MKPKPNFENFENRYHAWGEWVAVRLILLAALLFATGGLVWTYNNFPSIASAVNRAVVNMYLGLMNQPLHSKLFTLGFAVFAVGFAVLVYSVQTFDPSDPSDHTEQTRQ